MKQEPKPRQVAADKPAAAPARKPAAPRKRTAKPVQEVYLQFGGGQWSFAELAERAKAACAAQGHDLTDSKKLAVYVKPEERMVYYVVDGDHTGSLAL